MSRVNLRRIDPGDVPDGTYALSVVAGEIVGLVALPGSGDTPRTTLTQWTTTVAGEAVTVFDHNDGAVLTEVAV